MQDTTVDVTLDSVHALSRMVQEREMRIKELEMQNAGLVEISKGQAKVIDRLTLQISARNSEKN